MKRIGPIVILMIAAILAGCGDKDPVSSAPQEEVLTSTAKLVVSGTTTGGSRFRPASMSTVEGNPDPGGLVASAGPVGGASEAPVNSPPPLPEPEGEGEGEPEGEPEPETSAPLTFVDANLEAAVRDAISKSTGDILPSDVAELTRLSANSSNIASLEGIEKLTSLVELFLADNQISDISPIASLTDVSSLDLWLNQITDMSALANLTRLSSLSIHSNQIGDIAAVANLTNLDRLLLGSNPISDISALSGLTELQTLGLNNTEITDLTSLVDNSGLGSGDELDIRSVTLSADATATQIPALEARGVNVTQ
jgi:hypothetical protein